MKTVIQCERRSLGVVNEWTNSFSSFNSMKGLSYYSNYKQIVAWMNGAEYLPPPVECNLDPYAECQLECHFCITQRYLRHHREEVGEMRKLPRDYMFELVAFLAKWGVRGLCLSGGGEPTLHSDMPELMVYARDKGMDVALVTNAVYMTPALMESICYSCRWVALSVDAADRESYKNIKGADRFNKGGENISNLGNKRTQTNSKVDLCFKFLVLPENQNSIYKACLLAKSLGVQDFHCFPEGTLILKENGEFEDILSIQKGYKVLNGSIANVDNTLERNYKGDI